MNPSIARTGLVRIGLARTGQGRATWTWLLWCWLALWVAPVAAESDEESWWRPAPAADGGMAGILRSPADARQYRYVRLDNGLQVVLVSDPQADRSAAALSVAVGSFDNPDARPGLAHFLEHMLFLGTEKYPAPGAYQAFISDHGGSHNAYTSLERTTYFFDIEPPHLEAALDRFAQFFIAPLFDGEYVTRERNAVDAEYRLKLRDDGRRQGDVMAQVINPAHPLSKFSVGNAETLADREGGSLRDELLAFYRQYYSADRMTLAVSGKDSLDALERMVGARFGEISRRSPPPAAKPVPLLAEEGPLLVKIEPDRERRELSLLFELPPQAAHWQTKPAFFVAHLLGDEGERSLLAELKRRGWGEYLDAGLGYDSDRGAALALTVGLTPAGLAERETVLGLIWQWIARVRTDGLTDWRYRELAALQHVDFRFLDQSAPGEQVVGIAEALHDYPPAEVLRGPYVLERFAAAQVMEVLDRLRPEHALILLVAPELGELPNRSPYYQTPYQVERVGRQVAAWEQSARDAAATLGLPGPNPYLPRHFPVSERGGPADPPQRLDAPGNLELWHYADRRFGTPRAVFSARLLLPPATGTRGAALTALHLALAHDQLSAEVYPALLAGLDFHVSPWDGGIELGLGGYTDRQPLLLARVLGALAEPGWNDAAFARIRAQLLREWRNQSRDWPIRQAMAELSPLLREVPRSSELATELESVSPVELRSFEKTLYRRGAVKAYAGGVVAAADARDLAAMAMDRLGMASSPPEYFYRVKQLPAVSVSPRAQVEVTPEQKDTAVLWYVQGGEDSLAERARVALLQQLLDAPFYTTLRTERQLGYVVGSRILPFRLVPGMIFYVQSPQAGPTHLAGEIEQFVTGHCAVQEAMQPGEIARARQAVIARLEEQPKNLDEQVARHRESLALGDRSFDFRARLAAAVRSTDATDLTETCRRLFGEQRRGLWVIAAQADVDAGADGDADADAWVADGEFRYPW